MNRAFSCQNLQVAIFHSREEMGAEAAREGAACIRALLEKKKTIRVMFAAAPSQNELLAGLVDADVDWSRVEAYHMDDYVGLPANAPQRFSSFLKEHIFDRLPFYRVHYMAAPATELEAEKAAAAYDALLREAPMDICFMGIGENGHIAFNDPKVADFDDLHWTKVVKLEEVCRMQQVHDGCFSKISEVPTHAMTVTIPALMASTYVFCVVPSQTKANAVQMLLQGKKTITCPATALLEHAHAKLYLDEEAASKIK